MVVKGMGASPGAAVAELYLIRRPDLSVRRLEGQNPETEAARCAKASGQALAEIERLQEKAAETDPASAEIFEVHKTMLEDPDFCDGVDAAIAEGLNAEYAVRSSADTIIDFLSGLDNEVMRGRAADVRDVSDRLIRILKGIPDSETMPEGAFIVLAEDLLPSQTVKLDRKRVAGFVTKRGSMTAHAVILARTMSIPCVVGLGDDFDRLPASGELAVDGGTGEVLWNFTDGERAEYLRRAEAFRLQKAGLEKYRNAEAVAPDGKRVLVCANIGGVADAETAADSGADGVGLFRSEFLYLENPDFPDEALQFEAYRAVLQKMAPKPVVIRTLDLGSDKQAPYFHIPDEENPAMGYRAIRICLKEPDIFRTQLRALLRASVYGNLHVMFPMITGVGQVLEIKKRIRQAEEELDREGLPYSPGVKFGIMVETPAAAVMSEELAKEVDFFSIGTNDLTQYTMAADRTNAKVGDIFDSADPAVLRMIQMTAESAHKNGIWVGICGESAANTALTDFYMSVGIDELSVSPSSVPAVKKAVLESGPRKEAQQ